MSITLALWKLGQKDCMFQASLGYKSANLENTMTSGGREERKEVKGDEEAMAA